MYVPGLFNIKVCVCVFVFGYNIQGHAAAGAESLTRALRSRSQRLREDHDTQRLLHNLRDLVRALGEVEGSERDGDGDGQGMVSALLAVEEINLLGWRYFIVQDVSQGQTVLQQVCMCLFACVLLYGGEGE